MGERAVGTGRGRPPIHRLRNHLGVILGCVDLVLEKVPEHDLRSADLLEIKQAATAALRLLQAQSPLT